MRVGAETAPGRERGSDSGIARYQLRPPRAKARSVRRATSRTCWTDLPKPAHPGALAAMKEIVDDADVLLEYVR